MGISGAQPWQGGRICDSVVHVVPLGAGLQQGRLAVRRRASGSSLHQPGKGEDREDGGAAVRDHRADIEALQPPEQRGS
eukprot:4554746-Pyramimonas_sp.AAC.1